LFITLRVQQDFFYCVQLIAYNADRAAKAPNPKVYAELTKTLNNTLSQWAPNALKVCTDADKLNIPDTVVFAAKREAATEMYTKFIADVAEDENWVVSLLAQVPGIQVCGGKSCASAVFLTCHSRTLRSPTTSMIVLLIKVNDVHQCASCLSDLTAPTDTAWYKLWVADNAKHHKSTVGQVGEELVRRVTLSSH
jgi:hypothetical protein